MLAFVMAVAGLAACTSSPLSGSPVPEAPQDTDVIRTVTPVWIGGLQLIGDSSQADSCRWESSYPAVPGADELTGTLRDTVRTRLASFFTANGGSSAQCQALAPSEDPP